MFSSAGRTRTHIGGRQVLGMKLGENKSAVAQMIRSCSALHNNPQSQRVDRHGNEQTHSEGFLPASIEENQP